MVIFNLTLQLAVTELTNVSSLPKTLFQTRTIYGPDPRWETVRICLMTRRGMGSTAVDEVKMKVQRSSVCMSNSLAILGHMDEVLEKFGMHLHLF
ncbi:hypothetical protein Hanom_Chr08g00755861 [Helianthus anomalus]